MKNIDWGEAVGTIIGIGFWVLLLGAPFLSGFLPNNDASSSSVVESEEEFQSDSDYVSEPSYSDDGYDYDAYELESDYESTYASESSCNPNYSGCVEDSYYDLDCADIGFEVEVIGYDEYGLDRDGDGYGCETYY